MNKTNRVNLIYFVLAAFGVFLLHDFRTTSRTVATLPYSEFQKLLWEGKIRELVVSTNQVEGEFVAPVNGRPRFVTTRVESDLARQLDEHNVKYAGRIESSVLLTLLS